MFGILAAGLSSTFADDFNRADSANVTNNWTEVGPWEISGNAVRRVATGAAGFNRIFRTGTAATGFAECVPLAEQIGPMVASRAHEVAQQESCWLAAVNGGETRLHQAFYGGFPVSLQLVIVASTTAAVPNLSSDTLAIEVLDDGAGGVVFNVHVNGAVVITEPYGAPYTGSRGIICTGSADVSADNYAEGI